MSLYRALALLMLTGLTPLASGCKPRYADADLVARVNGEPVLKTEFDQQVEAQVVRYRGHSPQLPAGIEQRLKESILRRMIDDEIIAQKARTLQLILGESDVEAKFKEHRERFRSDQAFADYLKRANNTEANIKADLRRSLLRDVVIEIMSGKVNVSDDDVSRYFTENASRYVEPEQVMAQRILIRLPANAGRVERSAARKRADRALAAVQAKGADFGAIAKAQSDGPEAPQNGETEPLIRGHTTPLPLENMAFVVLKVPGEISPVYESPLGFEILKLLQHKDARQKPLAEVKEGIHGSLTARTLNDRRRDILRDLRAAAKIETLIQLDPAPPSPSSPVAPTPVPPDAVPAPALAPETASPPAGQP